MVCGFGYFWGSGSRRWDLLQFVGRQSMSESSRMGPCPSLGAFSPGHGTISSMLGASLGTGFWRFPRQYDLESTRQPGNKGRETRPARMDSSIADFGESIQLLFRYGARRRRGWSGMGAREKARRLVLLKVEGLFLNWAASVSCFKNGRHRQCPANTIDHLHCRPCTSCPSGVNPLGFPQQQI